MSQEKSTVDSPIQSGHVSVSSTRVAVTSNETNFIRGVLLRASPSNSVSIYIGGANVTADTAATSGGFPLAAGDSLFLEIQDLRSLFVVAASGTSDLAWLSI